LSRRDQIVMSAEEAAAFLESERIVTCATFGPRGWPHLMPLWYIVRDGTLWAWTYAKSQKVRNLERDPRCTLQVEAGGADYSQLRGVMLETEVVIHRDPDTVVGVGTELTQRYGGAQATPEAMEAMRRQAAKRVAFEFVERRRATWDHRKIAGY
jgi:PPOX class probable F420-dependent enzyme